MGKSSNWWISLAWGLWNKGLLKKIPFSKLTLSPFLLFIFYIQVWLVKDPQHANSTAKQNLLNKKKLHTWDWHSCCTHSCLKGPNTVSVTKQNNAHVVLLYLSVLQQPWEGFQIKQKYKCSTILTVRAFCFEKITVKVVQC